MRRKITAAISCLAALVTLCVCMALSCAYAFASGDCTLTIVAKSDSLARTSDGLSDVTVKVYKIGDRISTGGFAISDTFKNSGAAITDGITSEELSEVAFTLENYAVTNSVEPNFTGTTDSNGSLIKTGLDEGIYLVSTESFIVGNTRYTASPSVLELGGYESESQTISLKLESKTIPEDDVTLSVRKTWSNDSDNSRPREITVDLYKNNSLYNSVTLSASNGWYYEWKSSPSDTWRVSEREVSDYTVSYSQSGYAFYIKNTYVETTTSTTATSTTTGTNTTADTTTTATTTTTVTTAPTEPTSQVTTTTLPPREELKKRIEEYEELYEDDYTPESWEEFEEVLNRVKLILGDSDSTEEEIAAALIELETAYKKLVLGYTSYLPQTGQLWWPVPILAGSGVILIAVGIKVMRSKESKNEKKDNR